MPVADFRKFGHDTIEWISKFLENPARYPVLAQCKPRQLLDHLAGKAPERGEPMQAILGDFEETVLPFITHWNHPRFNAYFSISSSGPGILGELLTAALNVNAMLWKSCPAATELEQATLAWVLQWLQLPTTWFGMIVDSASSAALQAVVAGRQRAEPESRDLGPSRRLVAYVSEHTHSSVEKAAITAGIGQSNIRHIPVDSCFRMKPDELAQAIQADLTNGMKPFFAVATVGTTSSTAVDPVEEIAAICQKNHIWLHIDGAYGGAFAIVPEYRHILRGVEQADSLVINAHKMMMVPLDCSLFYTAHPQLLRSAFSLQAEYLKTNVPHAVDFTDYGLVLGRRFRALKLWFVLRYFGRQGLAANLRESLRMARWLGEKISADARFELMAPITLSLVCFRLRAGDVATEELMSRINSSGNYFVSHTLLNGHFTIRVAFGNNRTQKNDVEDLWDLIAQG